jgi:hypothetical protein
VTASHAGIFAYPWDFDSRTLRHRLERLAAIGLRRIILAVLYHEGRQLLPGAPVHVKWVRGGKSYVPVTTHRYPGGLAPDRAPDGLDSAEVLSTAREVGIDVDGWTVTLHRDDLVNAPGGEIPCVVNAFGEPDPVHLCPSSPIAEQYLLAHLRDISAAGFKSVTLEGCHFPAFRHGSHHESLLLPLGARHRWLLSICFCDACQAQAPAIDIESLQKSVAAELQMVFSGQLPSFEAPLTRESLKPDLLTLCDSRSGVVSRLIARLASATSLSIRFADQVAVGGAMFQTGRAGPEASARDAWQYGIDYLALSAACEGVAALGYLEDRDDLGRHLRAYIELGALPPSLHAVVRPMPPDTGSVEDLREKLAMIAELGITRTDFYSLSYCRETDLDTLAMALRR